ncbi:MAG: group I intron-associated PD-(D/E)XK endonuclease [Candidatus Omnitrophica bacterium]|nr:group I intron-associated PD-(D/E)XK endonuclease [Candidatus Omnitrophota bacterium]
MKADIAELAVTKELLRRGHNVLKPIGDRLAYDLAIDTVGKLIRLQIKCAWYDVNKSMYLVDSRRTRTNRRVMLRKPYTNEEFDFAIIYIPEGEIFYVMPVSIFTSYVSSIAIIEETKRQRPPRSFEYRERWDLLSV